MAAGSHTTGSFAADLGEEHAAMQGFLELLQREQQCLLTGDADGVGMQVELKSACLRKLAGHAERRRAFLLAERMSPDRPGMESWFAGHPEAATLAAQWQQLLELTRQAHQANETNGSLIAARLQSNQQALATLSAAANGTRLYGRDGQTAGNWETRRLGAA